MLHQDFPHMLDDNDVTTNDEQGGRQKSLRKPWLHAAVLPALSDGSSVAAVICRYCGKNLSSPNTSVRKKV